MPEYTAVARNGKPLMIGDDAVNAHKWLKKHNYKWLIVKVSLAADHEDPKTAEQLGYYWGLLLPAIHDQLKRDGHTQTIEFKGFTREIPLTKTAAHEIVTELCGRIGDNGELMRLSDCDLKHCIKFIDNVLNFAGELGMDTDKLKALRKVEL